MALPIGASSMVGAALGGVAHLASGGEQNTGQLVLTLTIPAVIAGIFAVVVARLGTRKRVMEKDQRDRYIVRLERDNDAKDKRITLLENRLDDFGHQVPPRAAGLGDD